MLFFPLCMRVHQARLLHLPAVTATLCAAGVTLSWDLCNDTSQCLSQADRQVTTTLTSVRHMQELAGEKASQQGMCCSSESSTSLCQAADHQLCFPSQHSTRCAKQQTTRCSFPNLLNMQHVPVPSGCLSPPFASFSLRCDSGMSLCLATTSTKVLSSQLPAAAGPVAGSQCTPSHIDDCTSQAPRSSHGCHSQKTHTTPVGVAAKQCDHSKPMCVRSHACMPAAPIPAPVAQDACPKFAGAQQANVDHISEHITTHPEASLTTCCTCTAQRRAALGVCRLPHNNPTSTQGHSKPSTAPGPW